MRRRSGSKPNAVTSNVAPGSTASSAFMRRLEQLALGWKHDRTPHCWQRSFHRGIHQRNSSLSGINQIEMCEMLAACSACALAAHPWTETLCSGRPSTGLGAAASRVDKTYAAGGLLAEGGPSARFAPAEKIDI